MAVVVPSYTLIGTTPPWTDSAIRPGITTRNGNAIFGKAAISGVRRAAVIESAAIARCTTRKSVHQ
jgi:hypothetical protein